MGPSTFHHGQGKDLMETPLSLGSHRQLMVIGRRARVVSLSVVASSCPCLKNPLPMFMQATLIKCNGQHMSVGGGGELKRRRKGRKLGKKKEGGREEGRGERREEVGRFVLGRGGWERRKDNRGDQYILHMYKIVNQL